MPPRRLLHDMKGNFEEVNPKDKRKYTPVEIPREVFLNMTRERDRLFYKEAQAKGDIATMEFLIKKYKNI